MKLSGCFQSNKNEKRRIVHVQQQSTSQFKVLQSEKQIFREAQCRAAACRPIVVKHNEKFAVINIAERIYYWCRTTIVAPAVCW
jgi:hypothetical protein